jgi:zinc protease
MRIVHYGLPDDYYTTYAERVGGITLDDARRVASELIHDDTLAVLVVGDRKVVESNLKEIGLPLVLVDYEGRAI